MFRVLGFWKGPLSILAFILLSEWFCALDLASVRRKHCVSTGVSFFFLELLTNFKFEKRVFVETQCLRLTNAKPNAQNLPFNSITQ
jgi:hypothetical protein